MTKKLYYDDQLQAAYMFQEFNVKLQHIEGNEFKNYDYEDTSHILNNTGVYDVHPDSLDIFKPQMGDIFKYTVNKNKYIEDSFIRKMDKEFLSYVSSEDWGDMVSDFAIIQRNGKPFFTPKEEA